MKILLIIIAASLIAFVGVPWLARRGAANFSDAALARYVALAANEEAAEVPEDQMPFVVGRTLLIDRTEEFAPSVDAAFHQIDATRRAGNEDEVRTVITVERGYSITAADRVFDSSTGRLASPPPAAGSEEPVVVVDAKEKRVLARSVIAGDDVAQAFAKMPGQSTRTAPVSST